MVAARAGGAQPGEDRHRPGGGAGSGGDCLADVAMLRAQPEMFGPVASDPVVSRLIARLAGDAPRALKVIRAARAAAACGWRIAATWPWATQIAAAITRLNALAPG